ncbi:MAG: hypothetical protein JNL72_14315 [Flavipsychrobacter sp.]|nr:hypothetical protein [Flavipsychrobacter sp.]
MKQTIALYLCLLLLGSCAGEASHKSEQDTASAATTYTPPPPGSVVAEDSVLIKESLNASKLTVRILSDEYSHMGSYKLNIKYGPDSDTSNFTLPKGAGKLEPILKKGAGYGYQIGFNYEGRYHEYCELTFKPGPPHEARFRQVKNYILK